MSTPWPPSLTADATPASRPAAASPPARARSHGMPTRSRPRLEEPTGDAARDRFRSLTEADVREMTDPGSFDRGRSYARSRQIFDASLRGETLHASSHGSSGGPYRVEATLIPVADAGAQESV